MSTNRVKTLFDLCLKVLLDVPMNNINLLTQRVAEFIQMDQCNINNIKEASLFSDLKVTSDIYWKAFKIIPEEMTTIILSDLARRGFEELLHFLKNTIKLPLSQKNTDVIWILKVCEKHKRKFMDIRNELYQDIKEFSRRLNDAKRCEKTEENTKSLDVTIRDYIEKLLKHCNIAKSLENIKIDPIKNYEEDYKMDRYICGEISELYIYNRPMVKKQKNKNKYEQQKAFNIQDDAQFPSISKKEQVGKSIDGKNNMQISNNNNNMKRGKQVYNNSSKNFLNVAKSRTKAWTLNVTQKSTSYDKNFPLLGGTKKN